jgi:hypothetical protein
MDGMEDSPGKRGRHHQSALLHRWRPMDDLRVLTRATTDFHLSCHVEVRATRGRGDAEEVAQEEIWLRP